MKDYVVTFIDGDPVTIKADFVEATAVAFVFSGEGTLALIPNSGNVRHIIAKDPEPAEGEPE